MSKNKRKLNDLDWEEIKDRQIRLRQERCKHKKFTIIKMLDFLNDRSIDTAVCKACGYSPAY